jgi:hypothetical protein
MSQTGFLREEAQTLVRPFSKVNVGLTFLGEHVDILGRASLNDLILRVAGGKGELIEEHILSHIREYADRVKIEDDAS